MKFNIFGYKFRLIPESQTLQAMGARTKKKQSWDKIKETLDDMERRHAPYSEYQLQKQSGLSINTVKKYRSEIEDYRKQIRISLF
jgi:hypothetical protein